MNPSPTEGSGMLLVFTAIFGALAPIYWQFDKPIACVAGVAAALCLLCFVSIQIVCRER